MKSKVAVVIGAIFMTIIVLFLVISGAMSLAKGSPTAPLSSTAKGTLCEVNASFAVEAFEIKNTINLIPIGKEHYYIMTSVENEDECVPFLVRAKPSWIDKRFSESDGNALQGSVKVKGVVSSINSDVRKEVSDMKSQLALLGINVSSTLYMDARYKEFGILRILSGIAVAILTVLSILGTVSGVLQGNKLLRVLLGIVTLAVAVLVLFTLQVGF